MIKEEMVTPVGRLFKPHGYKGELNADITYDASLFDNPKTPFFIKIDNILVPFFVERISGGANGTSFIKLKGIDSDLDALEFNKKEIYALKKFLADKFGMTEDELQYELDGFEGYNVLLSDTGIRLGIVKYLEDGVEYDYLIVEREGQSGTIAIPFIDEFVEKIEPSEKNDDKGEIIVNLPDGFLEI